MYLNNSFDNHYEPTNRSVGLAKKLRVWTAEMFVILSLLVRMYLRMSSCINILRYLFTFTQYQELLSITSVISKSINKIFKFILKLKKNILFYPGRLWKDWNFVYTRKCYFKALPTLPKLFRIRILLNRFYQIRMLLLQYSIRYY